MRKSMQILTINLILLAITLLTQPDATMANNGILAEQILQDSKKFSIDQTAVQTLNMITKEIPPTPGEPGWDVNSILKNALLITSAELALIESLSPEGKLNLPARIKSKHVIAAYLKLNTIDGGGCDLNKFAAKKIGISDIFSFSGDISKILSSPDIGHDVNKVLQSLESLDEYAALKKSYLSWRSAAKRPGIVQNSYDSGYLEIDSFLWFFKASVFNQKPADQIRKEAETVLKSIKTK